MPRFLKDKLEILTWLPYVNRGHADLSIYTKDEYNNCSLPDEIFIHDFLKDDNKFDEIILMLYPNFPIHAANKALDILFSTDTESEDYWLYNTRDNRCQWS